MIRNLGVLSIGASSLAAILTFGLFLRTIFRHDEIVMEILPFVFYATFLLTLVLFRGMIVRHLSHRNNLALQLFDYNEAKRRQAYEQLLQKGDEAVKIFTRILNETPRNIALLSDNFFEVIRLAAEGLGRLRAREGIEALMKVAKLPFHEIGPTAIWALAQIGDERATQAIIPSLLNKTRINRQKWLNYWAKEVLRANGQTIPLPPNTVGAIVTAALLQLGQTDLVAAFWKAWGGRGEDAVKELKAKKEFRKEIGEALTWALNNGTVSEAINAAHLLGELWAFDALPALRSKAQALSTPERVRKVCIEVAAKLEELSRLPMPASATEIDTSTLPRAVFGIEILTDTLPSLANPQQNSAEG